MTDTKSETIWKALRKPFPREVVGHMQRGGATLDFVGHAAVTDRLNSVAGPENWNWEPLSTDENGLPRLDSKGNLWIKLTINNVTKLGYGDGTTSIKELIGDALRNAAMRFGVALDLWSKEELESTLADPSLKNERSASKPAVGSASAPKATTTVSGSAPATPLQKKRITAFLRSKGVQDADLPGVLKEDYGIEDAKAMTAAEARQTLEAMEAAS